MHNTMNKNLMNKNVEIYMKEEVYQIIGAAIEVHKILGSGFLEPVYQEAFEFELLSARVPTKAQVPLRIVYKDKPLRKEYVADLVCFDRIIVEIKALDKLSVWKGRRSSIISKPREARSDC